MQLAGYEVSPSRWSADAWRMIEAQHVAATAKLLPDPEEQALLEAMLDASKPPLPAGPRRHYLLTTPWRYRPPAGGSRFRGEDDPGAWYGAESIEVAAAELGYWRCRFIRDTDGLQRIDPVAHTAFRAAIDAAAVDLRTPPLSAAAAHWTDPHRYAATQALGRQAREAGLGAIVYQSVRDPRRPPGWCVAVIALEAFAEPAPWPDMQTWFLSASATGAVWTRAVSGDRLRFEFD
jgi:hypothetical protein